MDRSALASILKDAQVVDVDFSEWDRCVRVAVIALAQSGKRRHPVYLLEFEQVSEFAMVIRRADVDAGEVIGRQWCSDEFTIDSVANGFRTVMQGSASMPALTIVARDCVVRELNASALDENFPNWNRPSAPHIRPGIEAMLGGRRPDPG